MAADTTSADSPPPQAMPTIAPPTPDIGDSTIGAPRALPANIGSGPTDASETRKFYTITASLREIYDDNVNTTNVNKTASLETQFSPSVLTDFPLEDGDFSARYTFTGTYYDQTSNKSLELSHEFVAQFNHPFSERFNLNLNEDFRYYTEPSLFLNVGTVDRSGTYVANILSGSFTAQWTPIFGSSTSYTNNVIKYDDAFVAATQDSVENIGSQNFSISVLPRINAVFGGIVDNITYDTAARGYSSYTADGGLSWSALPSLSASGSVGISYTESDQSTSSINPYAALSVNWQLGARSSLSGSYSHQVVPTDITTADAQVADRFASTFHYDINSDISVNLQGTFTHGAYTSALVTPGSPSGYTENDFALTTGGAYHLNKYLDADLGYSFEGVSSDLAFRDYTRNQFYVGLRGTY